MNLDKALRSVLANHTRIYVVASLCSMLQGITGRSVLGYVVGMLFHDQVE